MMSDVLPPEPPTLMRQPSMQKIRAQRILLHKWCPRAIDAIEVTRLYGENTIRTICVSPVVSETSRSQQREDVDIFNVCVSQGPIFRFISSRNSPWKRVRRNIGENDDVRYLNSNGRPMIIAWTPSFNLKQKQNVVRHILRKTLSDHMCTIVIDLCTVTYLNTKSNEPPTIAMGSFQAYVRDLHSVLTA